MSSVKDKSIDNHTEDIYPTSLKLDVWKVWGSLKPSKHDRYPSQMLTWSWNQSTCDASAFPAAQ
jgi:hypothetical protein